MKKGFVEAAFSKALLKRSGGSQGFIRGRCKSTIYLKDQCLQIIHASKNGETINDIALKTLHSPSLCYMSIMQLINDGDIYFCGEYREDDPAVRDPKSNIKSRVYKIRKFLDR